MSKLQKVYDMRFLPSRTGISLSSLECEEGQTLAEYAMILGLIAIVCVVVVGVVGGQINSLFSSLNSAI